jgi:hypothetical protein
MLMGMATPANNHKNANANDYGTRAILATPRLSSFEVKFRTTIFFFFKMFLWGLASRCLFWN